MLTKKQALTAIRAGRDDARGACGLLDGRDYARLASFFPEDEWEAMGCQRVKGAELPDHEAWTEANIHAHLASDLEFAFDKALGMRSISASLMYKVVKMWLWVLEDDLQHDERYTYYGLPLLTAVAEQYDLPNPIGDDTGDEAEYGDDGY